MDLFEATSVNLKTSHNVALWIAKGLLTLVTSQSSKDGASYIIGAFVKTDFSELSLRYQDIGVI
jgi:hypothetical protein